MFKVVKEVKWDAAHRLLNYEGKCSKLHGHSFRALFTFENEKLNKDGMVIDFNIIKGKIQGWIDECLDHSTILCSKDYLFDILRENDQKVFGLENNPTAENIAEFLFNIFELEFDSVFLKSVEVFEGSKSSAIYEE